jgi:hypothetical protein
VRLVQLRCWSALALRAPVQVAPCVAGGDDCGVAYQARRASPAVDVDLPAMPVLAWQTSHPYRIMLWPDGVDPAAAHPVAHQLDKIRPQRRPLISMQLVARLQRIQLVAKQQLSPVNVANSDQYLISTSYLT